MNENSISPGTKFGTIGGTLTVILANISAADLLKTIVLSAIGATVSFGISLLLKMILRKLRK